jgi:serine/threonine-protein kinase
MKPIDGSLDPTLSVDPGSDTLVNASGSPGEPGTGESAGYRLGALLGRGGMGEVVLAEDLRIGRSVAIKRMRDPAPSNDATRRFLREARIQARLDHPAIVPVHELGHDADGRPFFTMKRLTGVTLSAVLGRDEPLRKLLRVFVEACHAIDFAHARGVIHRDLKPANIMLGDYGEVYVLDWGVARVVGDREAMAGAGIESLDGETQAGAILGTPGYMSPEQVRGTAVERPTDVYALGSILFEILAGQPLHPRGMAALLTTEAAGVVTSPSDRAPARAIAPELDEACVAALAMEPAARPSVRALAERVQRYLDGDRDLAHRHELAATQLALARAAVESGDPHRRGEAMAAAGRALALHPESTEAAALVTKLMLEPPSVLPPPLVKRLEAHNLELIVRQGKIAALTILAYLGFAPVAIWMGVRDWPVVISAFAIATVVCVGSVAMARRRITGIGWAVFGNACVLVLLSRLFGSFVLVPGFACTAAVSLIAFPSLIARPVIPIAAMLGAFLLPFVLEATGVWARSWQLIHGELVIRPTALLLDGTRGELVLILGNAAVIAVTALFVRSLATTQRSALRQLEIQAWHLKQLLPATAS